MNGMLWTEQVMGKIVLLNYYNEMYQWDNCIKRDIWSDVIILVSITLFCDQGCKPESLEERRKIT